MVKNIFVSITYKASKILESLIKCFLAINHTKKVMPCEENAHVRFQNFKRLLKVPFIMYADFEIILKPITDNKNDGLNTKKISRSYCLQSWLQINIC